LEESIRKELQEANKEFPTLARLIREGTRYTEPALVMTLNGPAKCEIKIPTQADIKEAMKAAGLSSWSQLEKEGEAKAEKFNRALLPKVLVLDEEIPINEIIDNLAPGEPDRLVASAINLSMKAKDLERHVKWFHP